MLGDERAVNLIASTQGRLNIAIREAMEIGTQIAYEQIFADTPVWAGRVWAGGHQPGQLRASIRKDVSQTAELTTGRVLTSTSWAPFVEGGTREHGRAQRMFQRGLQSSEAPIKQVFENSVHAITGSF